MALCELRYYSPALGKQTAANVLLPEAGTPPFPTLYLLHGLSDDHTMWMRRSSIERYHSQLASPLIIVMPDGERGFYGNGVQGDDYETALCDDLVTRMDRTFPTRRDAHGRALAGLSMGGYGALRLALRRPDLFQAAASHSGAVHFGHKNVGWDDKPYPAFLQRVLGDDPVGGDFDLHALIEKCPAASRPALYMDCGTEDFLLPMNRAFHAHLVAQGVPHIYNEHPGAHNWEYWDVHVRDSLAFVCDRMNAVTHAADAELAKPSPSP